MKNLPLFVVMAGLLACFTAAGQAVRTPAVRTPPQAPSIPPRVASPGTGTEAPAESLTGFDLDFPGGRPSELVKAIERGLGRPLNVIIKGEDDNDVLIPPLKMNAVTVNELFRALEEASQSRVIYRTGTAVSGFPGEPGRRDVVQQWSTHYGFRTHGPVTDDSVWYFSYNKPPIPPAEATRICRFWQLGPYLESYRIEDIITAVQTGYDLLGEPAPKINFHKDTKLLIAVGEAGQLSLIDSVLEQLPRGKASTERPPQPPADRVDRDARVDREREAGDGDGRLN